MGHQFIYPFTAVIGQERIKKALLMNVINPQIGGVLITGEKGTAKSTLVRGLTELLQNKRVVELPLNASEEMVVGSIKLDKAIKYGKKEFEEGLLAKANNQILYIDEVNLLSETITKTILDVASSGINRVEREGISHTHPARFSLVGTMNPEEGSLSPQFLDRFGLFVKVTGEKDIESRVEVIWRRLEFEENPQQFCLKYESHNQKLREEIEQAKSILSIIEIPSYIYELATGLTVEANCPGHRADLCLVEAAKAIAALKHQEQVTPEDIEEAAHYVLPHRMREKPENQTPPEQQPNQNNEVEQQPDEQQEDNQPNNDQQDSETNYDQDHDHNDNDNQNHQDMIEEMVSEIGEEFKVGKIFRLRKDRRLRCGTGKRSRTRSKTKQGRFVKAIPSNGKDTDLAFMATLRAAAPFQRFRNNTGQFITIKDGDIRKKVREKRIGNTLMFVVDASGSMGVQQRMRSVKGAILSLLNDAYQKRDTVGMIAFRKDNAEQLLDITRSIDLAQKRLKDLPTGGRTPLTHGLYKGYENLQRLMLKDPDILPILIIITDGKANCAMNGSDPFQEALEVGKRIDDAGIQSLVIDIESGFIRLGMAKQLADTLGADYYKLDELNSENLVGAIRSIV